MKLPEMIITMRKGVLQVDVTSLRCADLSHDLVFLVYTARETTHLSEARFSPMFGWLNRGESLNAAGETVRGLCSLKFTASSSP